MWDFRGHSRKMEGDGGGQRKTGGSLETRILFRPEWGTRKKSRLAEDLQVVSAKSQSCVLEFASVVCISRRVQGFQAFATGQSWMLPVPRRTAVLELQSSALLVMLRSNTRKQDNFIWW